MAMEVSLIEMNEGCDLEDASIQEMGWLESTDYIGPARVLNVRGKKVLVSVGGHRKWAIMALGYDYSPNAGDVLLVIGKQLSWYVIGVISGSGGCKWTVPRDLEIDAPRGAIRFSAAQGISFHTSKLDIVSKKLRMFASSLIERFVNVRRTISDTLDEHTGRTKIKVESTHRMTARRIRQKAEKDIKLDGHKIHLG